MTILLINYEYPPIGAGAANATRQLAMAFRRLGHEPVVLTAAFGALAGRSQEDGVWVHRVPCLRRRQDQSNRIEMYSFLRSALRSVKRVALDHGCECAIVFFTLPCGPVARRLKRETGIPYVVSLRGGDVPGNEPGLAWMHFLLAPARRAVLSAAAALVANDQGLADRSMAADPYPVDVIPNGVDCDFFRPAQAPREGCRPFRWLFSGRLHSQKNVGLLLGAFSRLDPSSRGELHVAGDGPERGALADRASRLGIAGCVRWHGWLEKAALLELYQSADAFINPSRYEGMPNTVLEAMACGLPSVLSAIPSHNTLARGGETALLVDMSRAHSLADAMQGLQSDDALRLALGSRARLMVASSYTWLASAESYLARLGAATKR